MQRRGRVEPNRRSSSMPSRRTGGSMKRAGSCSNRELLPRHNVVRCSRECRSELGRTEGWHRA
jgi:hypothetical protein